MCPTAPEEKMKISRDESLPLRSYAPGELAGTMNRVLTDFLLRQRHVGWGTVHAGPSENLKISPAEISEMARLYYGEFG